MEVNQTETREELLRAIKAAEDCYKREMLIRREKYEDDDTHEIVEIERKEILSETQCCTDEEKDAVMYRLMSLLNAAAGVLTDQEIAHAIYILEIPFGKGKEYLGMMENLAENGYYNAYYKLGYSYRFGRPENGIFKNKALALRYMELAFQNDKDWDEILVEPDSDDDEADEPDPCYSTLCIRGTASQYEAISALFSDLCRSHGEPDNELGMFVPLGIIIRTFVDCDLYEGNVMSLERHEDGLYIDLEAEPDGAEALKYALMEGFGKMEIEIVDR